MTRKLFFLLLFPLMVSAQIPKGLWQGEFKLNDSTNLPVKFDVKGSSIEFINAQEKIKVTEITYKDDSAFIQMPVFDSEIRCKIVGDSLIGNFLNHARTKDNVIPFKASYGRSDPMVNSFELSNFEGRWEVTFAGDDPPLNKAVGEFSQQ